MGSKRRWFFGMMFVVAALAAGPAPARADIAPPGSCSAPGQPCTTAGTSHDQAGTCLASTCTKAMPLPDGGTTTTTYACNLCQTSGAGGAGGSGADGSTTNPPSSSSCAVGGRAGDWSLAGPIALTGLLLTVGRRRRRCR